MRHLRSFKGRWERSLQEVNTEDLSGDGPGQEGLALPGTGGSPSAVPGGDGGRERYKGADGAGRTVADLRGFPSAGVNPLGKGRQAAEESGVGVK